MSGKRVHTKKTTLKPEVISPAQQQQDADAGLRQTTAHFQEALGMAAPERSRSYKSIGERLKVVTTLAEAWCRFQPVDKDARKEMASNAKLFYSKLLIEIERCNSPLGFLDEGERARTLSRLLVALRRLSSVTATTDEDELPDLTEVELTQLVWWFNSGSKLGLQPADMPKDQLEAELEAHRNARFPFGIYAPASVIARSEPPSKKVTTPPLPKPSPFEQRVLDLYDSIRAEHAPELWPAEMGRATAGMGTRGATWPAIVRRFR